MRVPLKWLQEFVEVTWEAERLAERLTMQGVAVDAVEKMKPDCHGVVVGRILNKAQHPQEPRLSVVEVFIGDSTLQVVCGDPQIQPGNLVPVALPGACLPGGKMIETNLIHGVESQGMLCATTELLFGKPHIEGEGVLQLQDALPGTDVISLLDLEDDVLVLDLTPNYAACLSILGVAYEVAALTGSAVRNPLGNATLQLLEDHPDAHIHIEDPDLCHRYAAKLVEDVRVTTSPPWLQWRLHMAGMRPINNVVDITNYVMIEVGQPLHAFDHNKLGNRVVVRRALDGERLITLDGIERQLSSENLVIADSSRPVALAGVMGGIDTEVTLETSSVLIESAYFDPVSVRRTSGRLGIRSEASLRFEKGVDPSIQALAAERAAYWMERLGAGRPLTGVILRNPRPASRKTIELRLDRACRILGVQLSMDQAKRLLQSLDFEVSESGNVLRVVVPTRRGDVNEEIDLVEELARTYGYSEVPASCLQGNAPSGGKTHEQLSVDRIRDFMVNCGLQEVLTSPLIGPEDLCRTKLAQETARSIRLANPLAEDQSLLPTTLLPGVMRVMAYNVSRGCRDLKLFEIGKVFLAGELPPRKLPHERLTLVIAGTGRTHDLHWTPVGQTIDFFWIKGIVEALVKSLGVEVKFLEASQPQYHPYRQAQLGHGGQVLGFLGELHPNVLRAWDIPQPLAAAELNLELLLQSAQAQRVFTPLPRYPSVERDIAFVVDESIPFDQIISAIMEAASPLAVNAQLFDVFKGGWVPQCKRSLAVRITYRSNERTLTDEEVNSVHQKVREVLGSRFSAVLRS
ncbi:MAG: phenylalanine--tRNA ligase subunit beta [Bacillota bacterium]